MDANLDPKTVFKFCPRCGSGDFVPKREDQFICNSCFFQYYLNAAASVAGIIVDSHGRILLTKRGKDPAKGKLDLPGGFVDFGETAEDALKREVMEEINLQITNTSYFCSIPNIYTYAGFNYHTLDLFYTCQAVNMAQLKIRDEISGYVFRKSEEISLDEIGLQSVKRGLHIYFGTDANIDMK